ncbi:MAG: baseplate J/gp47 family protein [Pyrinomonadaceae bacterium]
MPLEIPNLDDRRWVDLVEEARSLIPLVAPRWTDHNAHDPGMTFIELFAWLAEMQLYQLNRVGQRHREVFGRLAGVRRKPRKPARVDVRVEGILNAGTFMPAGTQLTPLEGPEIVFETDTDLFLTRSRLLRVITHEGSSRVDQTEANAKPGIAFLAFGEDAREGAELRLGFDKFYPAEEREIRLTANVFADDLVERCGPDDPLVQTEGEENTSGVDLAWEYLVAGDRWLPLKVLNDQTSAFSHSGAITLAVPADVPDPGPYWIRSRIRQGYYDIEPRLRSISLNVLPCSQKETVRDELLGQGNGKPDQSFELAKKEPVLVPEPEPRATITSSDVADWVLLANELDRGRPALAVSLRKHLAASSTNRLSDYERITELNLELASSNSVRQTAEGPTAGNALESEFAMPSEGDDEFSHLIGRKPVVVTVGDEPWRLVSSFDSSSPTDTHYLFDIDSRCVEFGNGLNGKVPVPGQQVRAIWYRVSSGRSGNVAKGLKWKFRNAVIQGATLTNLEPATGGADPEPLDEMELRTRSLLNRPQRAVTLKDLEFLTLSTPNAYVARAKAITNCPAPESITVVAVPKVRPGRKGALKAPSSPFLRKVERQLQQSRLLCDSLRVIGPIYIEVRVSARLRLLKGAGQAAVLERARKALDRFLNGELQPADQILAANRDSVRKASIQSPCPTRWPFGRSVFPSEVYAILDGVTGADFASNVVLSAARGNTAIKADKTGAIPIPQVGLVYAGSHDLTVEPNSGRNA